jgi:hypothetical protein
MICFFVLPEILIKEICRLWIDVRALGMLDSSVTNCLLRERYLATVSDMVLIEHIVYFMDLEERINVMEREAKPNSNYFAPKSVKLFRKWTNSRGIVSSNISVHLDSSTRNLNEYAFDLAGIINVSDSKEVNKLKIYNIPVTFLDCELGHSNTVLSYTSVEQKRIDQRNLFTYTVNLCVNLHSLTMSSFGLDDRIIVAIHPHIMSNLTHISLIVTYDNKGFTKQSAIYIAKCCKNLIGLLIEFYMFDELDESWNQESIDLITKCNLKLKHLILNSIGGSIGGILNSVMDCNKHIVSIEVSDSNITDLICCNIMTTLIIKCFYLKKIIFSEKVCAQYTVAYFDNTFNEYSVAPLGKGLYYRNYYTGGLNALHNLLTSVHGFVCIVLESGYNSCSVRLLGANNPKLEVLVLCRDDTIISALCDDDLQFLLLKCPLVQIADGPRGTLNEPIQNYLDRLKL